MSTTLVTAIYFTDREGTLGGRSWREQYYFASLQNIYNFGLPIIIFCDKNGYKKIENFLKYLDEVSSIGNPGWKIILSELDDFYLKDHILTHRQHCVDTFRKQAQERKKTNPDEPGFFHARCEILCHRKIFFVKTASEFNYFNTDNFCWIDSGVTHWGLTPFSKGGVEINNFFSKKHYYPYNKNNIYTPQIGKGIDNLINDYSFFQFKHNNTWYSGNLGTRLTNFLQKEYGLSEKDSTLNYHMVGGLIGLKPNELDELTKFYEKALIDLASTRVPNTDFFTEEIIFTAYYKVRKHHLIHFDDWSHDSENDPCFIDYGEENEKRKELTLFYKVWDIVKNYTPKEISPSIEESVSDQ